MLIEKKFDNGTITYKKPNVIEGLEILGLMGLRASDLKDGSFDKNEFVFMARLIKSISFLIKKVDLVIDNKTIKSYDDALDSIECIPMISQVASEIMGYLLVSDKKKETSETLPLSGQSESVPTT